MEREPRPGSIDWEAHKRQYRARIEVGHPTLEKLRSLLKAREGDKESYDGHYAPGNNFSNQAEAEIAVLRQLIEEEKK